MMARQSLRRFSKSSNEEIILAPPGSPTLWSNQSEEGHFPPTPPPKPPLSLSKGKDSRPGSSRRRKYSASLSLTSNDSLEGYADVDPFARRPSRPSSSLSKYKPLPDININHNKNRERRESEQNVNKVSRDLKQMSLVTNNGKDEDSAINKKPVGENKNTKSPSVKNDERKPEKRQVNEGKCITLAIKIPTTGSRITKSFKETETLHSVLKYAETECGETLSQDYYLAVNVPRRIFENPRLTIKQTGLEDKTTLFLFEKDMI